MEGSLLDDDFSPTDLCGDVFLLFIGGPIEVPGAFELFCIAQGAMPRPGCFVFDCKRCTALLLGKVAFLPVLAAAPPTAQGATPVTASGGCFGVAPAPEPAAQGATPVTVSGG